MRSAHVSVVIALGISLCEGRARAEPMNDDEAIARATIDPSFRKNLLTDPKKALATTDRVKVIEEPDDGRVFVLPPVGNRVDPPAEATPEERFRLELSWNGPVRRKLLANWKLALRDAKLPTPESGTLKIVELQPGERALVLPRPNLVPEAFVHTAAGAMRAVSGTSSNLCPKTGCPGGGGDPPPPPPRPTSYRTTILRIDHKRWNQNPLGPGCKNNDRVPFRIPPNATLESITIGEYGCDTSGPDMQPGTYVDTHVAFGIVAGGTVLNSRPPNGSTGDQELSYHWWFNQWGHSQAFICINVKSKKPLALDSSKTDRFTHLNMDDGWVKHRVKLPVCFREVDVGVDLAGPIDGRPLTYMDIKFGAKVTNGDHCVIEWFGCRGDNNTFP